MTATTASLIRLKQAFWWARQAALRAWDGLPHTKPAHCTQADAEHARNPLTFAHVVHKKNCVCFALALADLSDDNLRGVFCQQFGALLDEWYEPETDAEAKMISPLDMVEDPKCRADRFCDRLMHIEIRYDAAGLPVPHPREREPGGM